MTRNELINLQISEIEKNFSLMRKRQEPGLILESVLEYIYPCTTISANKKMLKYINLVCDTLKKINELKSICGSIEVYESYSFRLSNAKLSIEKNNKRIEILIDFSSPHERASFTCVEVLFNILGVKKQEIIERMAFLREKAFE